MSPDRRQFLKSAIVAGGLGAVPAVVRAGQEPRAPFEALDRAASEPVLRTEKFKSPVLVESLELLRNGRTFLVRARSSGGATGLAIVNGARLIDAYPIFLNRVAPFFVGKDARELDALVSGVYISKSNYKLQGVAFWACVAAAEFALLDLLGRMSGQSIGELLGGVVRRDIAVYRASGNRGNRPEEEVAILKELVEESGAPAVKFKVGGRMRKNADSLPGRSEKLVPLVREALGDSITLYADSNGSYDARKSIEIGRLMEKYDYGFFEEPCPFDHLEETKEVADALRIPIAGGEQESSMHRFRWMIHHGAVQIVQPDLHYFGGYVRCMRVARMAAAAGLLCTPHMSGSGLGYMDVVHFASCVSNAGPHQEFKGTSRLPVSSESSSLRPEKGKIRVPSGPGFGIDLDPDFVKKAERVTTV